MPNVSHKTIAVATRLDLRAYNVIKRRSEKRKMKVSNYIRERIETDALRRR